MAYKQRPRQKSRLRGRLIMAAAVSTFLGIIVFSCFFVYLNTGVKKEAKATTNESFSIGSFIVNMGVTPQTKANALKPYGLVYDLVTNYNIPVKWVINPTKVKDGINFSHNGVEYKGNAFIIPAEYITTSVSNQIETWRSQGVQGNYSISGITVPVYMEIKSFPRISINNLSGNNDIVMMHYMAAGIPESAFNTDTNSTQISCNDIIVKPNGDVDWSAQEPDNAPVVAAGETTKGNGENPSVHNVQGADVADAISGSQRFLNSMFLAGLSKALQLTANIAGNLNADATTSFNVTASGGNEPYTYAWTSSAGGTFSAPNGAVTGFTAPHTNIPLPSIITCVITDKCNRRTFVSQIIKINPSPLPTNLIDFQANPQPHNAIKLEWETAKEINIHYFTLERSLDGVAFSTIRKIHSQGNTSSTKLYMHIDANPLKGISYYRLSQTDSNGTIKVLQTEQVTFKSRGQSGQSRLTVGPNPFSDHITLYNTSEQEGPIIIRIYSVSGNLVSETRLNNTSASESMDINGLEKLPKGIYLLKTYCGGQAGESIRIVK